MELKEMLEKSKHRFNFDTWPRRIGADALVQVKAFSLGLPDGWAFEQRVAYEGSGYCDYFYNPGNQKQRIMVRVLEHPDHEVALLSMLHILTMSTALTLPRLDERDILLGDVGFCGHSENITHLSFVRHNVLIDIRSIGDEPVDVVSISQAIDSQIQALVSV